MATTVSREFIDNLPKTELHVHLEGTLEPELRLKLAQKNHIDIGTTSLENLKATYQYDTLASFLAVYYSAMAVLQTEDDFYDLAFTYLKKARQNNVRHVEMFFDPRPIQAVASVLKQSSMVYRRPPKMLKKLAWTRNWSCVFCVIFPKNLRGKHC